MSNFANITILLPAFNEESSIAETVKNICFHYPGAEVLVVDDGSKDNTALFAHQAGAEVISHPYNIGNGAAIKTGLRDAKGDWVVMLDADGQHNPQDILSLLEHKDRYDMVVGARKNLFKSATHRNIANKIYNILASYITKFKIKDLTSGFRLVKKETARKYLYLLPNQFSYPTTLTMAYLRCGRSVKYVPIQVSKRTGKSKIKIMRDGVRFFLTIAKIATLFSPFRIFLPISFFFFLLGNGYYAFTYLTSGRFTNMSALLLSVCVMVFLLGLISEQITQIRYDRVDE